jgi:hypothetical protein
MNILDYIVPIFYKSEFNGSGFIVGTVLVTAAHVVISEKSSFSILYRGQKIPIGPEKNIIFEYPKEKDKQGLNNRYWDLAVYKMDNIVSPLVLQEPNFSEECLYQGYSDSTLQVDSYSIVLNNNAYYYPPEYDAKPIPINNCCFSQIGKCKPGNSGGPLFQGNSVVGMLSGEQQLHNLSWDRIIKADYILHKILKHDSNNTSDKTIDK